jgi:hypothetical protein
MDDINDMMRDVAEKGEVVDALRDAERGMLIVPNEDGGWGVRMFAMTWGEMAYAMMIAKALLERNLLEDEDD